MATVQKTTLKRYNGTDWDPIYLANSADISYIGTGFNVAAGDGWTIDETISADSSVYALLQKAINNLTKLDKVTVPAIVSGESITALAANKLTGTVSRANLPEDVGGKGVEVASEAAKAELDKDDVNIGDLVKVTGGKVYLVTGFTGTTPTYMELSDSASTVAWNRITGTPTTLAGYGITDAVNSAEKVTTASAENVGKILVLNNAGKMDVDITGDAATLGGEGKSYYATAAAMTNAEGRLDTAEGEIDTLQSEIRAIDATWITSGTISIDRLPASAVETVYVAADDAARAALTTAQVQNGDTVKVTATNLMYFVVDETKLGTADWESAYMEYTVSKAAAVDWSGVENKPTAIKNYASDAVDTSDLVETASAANAGKLLKINATGKMDTSITGDAASLGGNAPSYYGTAADVTALQNRVGMNDESGLSKRIADLETTVDTATTGLVDRVGAIENTIGDADTTGTIKYDIAQLKAGTAITALAANKITGTLTRSQLPADISGRMIKVADMATAYTTRTADNTSVGDLVKTNAGAVYAVVDTANLDNAQGYEEIVNVGGSQILWSQITGTPTTLAGYGITDAVNSAEKVTTASAANAGKILVLNAAGKLDVDVTGDANTLDGHDSEYFATKSWADGIDDVIGDDSTADTILGDIAQLQTDIRAIDATWITSGTIDIARLPHGALERCIVVADDAARFALTTATAQTGDTVKVTATDKMYFIVDDTKLSSEDGYEVYKAGAASSVDWSGVQNKPTTLAGYGITDAVNASEKVTVASAANAGKILVLNSNGKLDVDITGTVDWANINDKPSSTVAAIDDAVSKATHTNRAVLDKLGEDANGRPTYDGEGLAYKSELDQVALGSLQVVNAGALPVDADEEQLVLEAISAN